MLASVYRSQNKAEMYLYVRNKDDFSGVPEALMKVFGNPIFALQLNLSKRKSLARVDIETVKQQLASDGFYLQMPPSILDDQAGTR